jgi:hypothetical protein
VNVTMLLRDLNELPRTRPLVEIADRARRGYYHLREQPGPKVSLIHDLQEANSFTLAVRAGQGRYDDAGGKR